MRLLLVYPPFAPPSVMPYSISRLKSIVGLNCDVHVKCLDLNAKFHKERFAKQHSDLSSDYWGALSSMAKEAKEAYAKSNRAVRNGNVPELLPEMINLVQQEKPDMVALSIVYSSQVFYAKALLENIEVPCLIGGPAVSKPLMKLARYAATEEDLMQILGYGLVIKEAVPDFSDYQKDDYFTKEIVLPVKTSSGCYYGQCAFCTHHKDAQYIEHPLDLPDAKNYFLIDDMVPVHRLIEIAAMMKARNAKWMAGLRPTKEILPHLRNLVDSGLHAISWGVESGSQDVLDRMRKGTNLNDIADVLKASKDSGIRNIIFVMFGFPGETREQFLQTIRFCEDNGKSIDLVSSSIFGLQRGSLVYEKPSLFGVTGIHSMTREWLDEKITYECDGLSSAEVKELKKRHQAKLDRIAKMPKIVAYLKEQAFFS